MQFNNRFRNLVLFMEKVMFNSIMTKVQHLGKCWMIVISIAKLMKEMNQGLV